jgi:hypothetical protein
MMHIFICMDQADDPLAHGMCLNMLDQFGDVINSVQWPFEVDQVTVADNMDLLLILAKSSKSKWGLFFKYGNHVTFSFMRNIRKNLMSVDQNTAVIGHVLDRGDRYYELHDQAFVLNLDKFKTTNRVLYKPTPGHKPVIDRSMENYHDGYTPKWVKPGVGEVLVADPAPGADLVAFGIQHGAIRPFDDKERRGRFHTYPTTSFYDNISKIEREIANTQTRFYLFNTDGPVWEYARGYEKVSRIVMPASGFLPFEMARETDLADDFKFVFYDCSFAAQHLYTYMLNEWDGRDPRDITAKATLGPRAVVIDGDMDTLWNEMMDRFGGLSEWLSFFHEYRNRYHYRSLDIMTGFRQAEFTDTFRKHQQVIYSLTNIYWYGPTSFLNPHRVRADHLNNHLSHLREIVPEALVYYSMPGMSYHGLAKNTVPYQAEQYPWRDPRSFTGSIINMY